MKKMLFTSIMVMLTLIACNQTKKTTPLQCTADATYAEGILRNFSGFDGCGWIIQLEDSSKLEPVNLHDFTIEKTEGKRVQFCYKEVQTASICMIGKTIQLAAIQATNAIPANCNNAICTMDYRTISLKINYVSVPPYDNRITAFKTIDALSGNTINEKTSISNTEHDIFSSYGYPVVSDGQIAQGSTEKNVVFIAYRNSTEVARVTLKVGHDCCHIFKISGASEINL